MGECAGSLTGDLPWQIEVLSQGWGVGLQGGRAQDSLAREVTGILRPPCFTPFICLTPSPCSPPSVSPWALPHPLGSQNTVGRLRQAGGVLDTQREGGGPKCPPHAGRSEQKGGLRTEGAALPSTSPTPASRSSRQRVRAARLRAESHTLSVKSPGRQSSPPPRPAPPAPPLLLGIVTLCFD